jgi:hypothetical protein
MRQYNRTLSGMCTPALMRRIPRGLQEADVKVMRYESRTCFLH